MKTIWMHPVANKVKHLFSIKYIDKQGVFRTKSIMSVSKQNALIELRDYIKIISVKKI